ncbi:MAG: hypothetical protein AAFN74_06055 [Myxococcota bacterium]
MNGQSKVLRGLMVFASMAALLTSATTAEAQRRGRPRRVIRIAETRIEGRIQKPQAFYILQRSNLNFEGLELKNSFVPKIIKSVDKAPF